MVTITSASKVTEWLWVWIGLFLTFKEALSFLMGTNSVCVPTLFTFDSNIRQLVFFSENN